MNKIIIIILLSTFITINCQDISLKSETKITISQDSSFFELNNSVGLKLSNISGYGIYFNRKMTNNINLQLMGLIYYYMNKDGIEERTNFNYDIGLEIQYNFFRNTYFRAYYLAGAYYYFDDDETIYNNYSDKIINNSFNVGVGIAGEFYFKQFVLSFDLGYKFFEDHLEHKNTNNNAINIYPETRKETKIGAGIGIGFMF